MAQSRRNGSIFQRKARRWVVSIKDATTGKHIEHYAASEAEARRKLRTLKRRLLWKYLFRKHES